MYKATCRCPQSGYATCKQKQTRGGVEIQVLFVGTSFMNNPWPYSPPTHFQWLIMQGIRWDTLSCQFSFPCTTQHKTEIIQCLGQRLGRGYHCNMNGSWHRDIAPALPPYQKMAFRSLTSTNDCFSLKSTPSYITLTANKRHHGSSNPDIWCLGRHHLHHQTWTKSTKAPTSLRPWHWKLIFHENAAAFKRTASIFHFQKFIDQRNY